MNAARGAWVVGSILVNVTIGIYLWLSRHAPLDPVHRQQYLNDHWTLYSGHWKAELVFMTLIAVGALFFAIRLQRPGWTVTALGQVLLLTMYPVMLGGYRNTSVDIANVANEIAVTIFLYGNVVFLAGLLLVYRSAAEIRAGLRWLAMGLSSVAGAMFLASFLEFIDWRQALQVCGPFMSMLYLINAYYGYKLDLGRALPLGAWTEAGLDASKVPVAEEGRTGAL